MYKGRAQQQIDIHKRNRPEIEKNKTVKPVKHIDFSTRIIMIMVIIAICDCGMQLIRE